MQPDLHMPPQTFASDFSLTDHLGKRYSLADALSTSAAIIVFYRGHWCPYCRRYLRKLQLNNRRFIEHGAHLAAVSPEPRGTSSMLAAQLGIEFPLLSDERGSVIDQFGVRNGFAAARTVLPHPAVVIIDSAFAIRFKSVDRNYKRRTTMHTIFAALEAVSHVS
jgi:peroxiredoxin